MGYNLRNITQNISKLLNDNYPDLNEKAIISKGFQNIEEVRKIKNENVELIYYPDANGMKRTMFISDLAVSAAGQTSYELAKIGISAIAVGMADDQLVI